MPLEPKFQRRRGGPSLPRPFVDRQEHLDAFWNSLHRSDLSQPRVLVFHGLGGIGKSRLRKELRGRLAQDDPRVLWAEVDFSLPTLRDPETTLFSLRRQFSDGFGVPFPTFDLAYAYLWKLTRPNVAPLEEGRPLFVAGTLVASFFSSVGVPLVSFVANAVEKGNKPLKAWWTARGRDDLKELSRLDPPEIEQRLPAYLAEDLSDHLGKRKLPGVIFFDTHEALLGDPRSEEQRLLKDAWLRGWSVVMPRPALPTPNLQLVTPMPTTPACVRAGRCTSPSPQVPGTPGDAGWGRAFRRRAWSAFRNTGPERVHSPGPRFCNRCRNDREVARLPLMTAAPARVTILTKAEGGTQWDARKRAARMSRSLSRTRSRKGRAGALLLESL